MAEGRQLYVHWSVLVVLILGLMVWAVALGGLAAVTHTCLENFTLTGESAASYCSRTYQMEWWSIMFEFFLLLAMLATSCSPKFAKAKFVYLMHLVLVTALLTVTSRNLVNQTVVAYLDMRGWTEQPAHVNETAQDVASGGAVGLCIINFALIIFLGLAVTAPPKTGNSMSAADKRYVSSVFSLD